MKITTFLKAAFPKNFSEEDHQEAMQKHLPRIVGMHASGNTALQQGHYASHRTIQARRCKIHKAHA